MRSEDENSWAEAAARIAERELVESGDPRDPVSVVESHRRAVAATIAIAISESSRSYERSLEEVRLVLGDDAAILLCQPTSDGARRLADSIAADPPLPNPAGAGGLYEKMIGVFPFEEGSRVPAKSLYRQMGGVFYTPPEFASRSSDRVLGRLLESDPDRFGETPPVIADLSAGAGSFLVATVSALTDRGASPDFVEATIRSMWFADVDPIALDLARYSLELSVGVPGLAVDLRPRSLHGNPLMPIEEGRSPDEARAAFLEGFIYDDRLCLGRLPDADLVVGNPPWERIRVEDRQLFAHFAPQIAATPSAADRAEMISRLADTDPWLFEYQEAHHARTGRFLEAVRADPRFEHSRSGEIFTHALFAELALAVTADPGGFSGLLVKSTLISSRAHANFLSYALGEGRLLEAWGFTNRRRVFPIDGRERFSLLVFGPPGASDGPVRVVTQLETAEEIGDEKRLVGVSDRVRESISPDFGLLPARVDHQTVELLEYLSESGRPLEAAYPGIHFGRLVHLTNHRASIGETSGETGVPILEGRMIHQYDRSFATFAGIEPERRYRPKAPARRIGDRREEPVSRYFIERDAWEGISRRYREPWTLVWRSASSHGNTFPVIATLVPHQPTLQSLQILQVAGSDPVDLLSLLALFNSTLFGWSVRQRMGGIDVTSAVIREIPVPPRDRWEGQGGNAFTSPKRRVAALAASILSCDPLLAPLVEGLSPDPENAPDPETRLDLMRRIDEEIFEALSLRSEQREFIHGDRPRVGFAHAVVGDVLAS